MPKEVIRIFVGPVQTKRTTGWGVLCPEHGASQSIYRSKKRAIGSATEHVDRLHGGKAAISYP